MTAMGITVWVPHLNRAPALYSLTIVIASVAMILGVYNSAKNMKTKCGLERVVMQWLLTVAFCMKLPYLYEKILALIAISILSVGYATIAVLDTVRYVTGLTDECN